MTMNKKTRITIALALFLAAVSAEAQVVSPVDFMRMNPYQMNSNPATDLPYLSYMSLLVGNTGLDVKNTGLRYDNFFDFDAQGKPATINLKKFANSIYEDNSLDFSVNANLFSLGKRLNKGMITFGYDERVRGSLGCNDGLVKLLANGNAAFVGEENRVVASFGLDLGAYQELSVGYQLNVTNRLSVGGRAKLLFGMANVKTNAFAVSLATDPESYALRVNEDIWMQLTMPDAVTAEDGKLKTVDNFHVFDLFRNPGFGVDLAGEYHFTDQIGLVAAVNDLGFIKWRANNIQLKGNVNDVGTMYDDGAFLFEGLDINQLQRIVSDKAYRELFMDTLKQYFQLEFSPSESYITTLNTNVLLRGYYDINPQNRVSLQAMGCFRNGGFSPALTLAYSGSFFEMLDVCATYTMMKGSYANFGIGLAANIGTFHLYLTTNNIIGAFNALNSNGFNAQVGIVFNLRDTELVKGSRKPKYMR